MALITAGIIGGVIQGGLQVIRNWQEKKMAKQQGEIAIAKASTDAKIKRLQTREDGDIAWENTALVQTGIKDEVMMFVVLAPMIMCFIPGMEVYVQRGFQAMQESLPKYWEYAFYCTVAVSYGMRKWTDFMAIRKGG